MFEKLRHCWARWSSSPKSLLTRCLDLPKENRKPPHLPSVPHTSLGTQTQPWESWEEGFGVFPKTSKHQQNSADFWCCWQKMDVEMLEQFQRRPWGGSGHLLMETGWESWGCSPWRREGFVQTPQLLPGSGGATGKLKREKSLGDGVTGKQWVQIARG